MRIMIDTYDMLEPFQRTGVDFLANRRSALLADEVGAGKTVQAIHACQQVGARSILIICTASIKYNWRKEAIKWGYSEGDIHILNNKSVQRLPEEGMFIINYDLCWRKNYARYLLKRRYDVLICDEAHYLKNHTAKRSKAVYLSNGYADISTYRWMITATPVLNRPVELHAMLRKLCPETLGPYLNYVAYTQRYCEGKNGKWGYEANGAENLEELAGRLGGFMLRRQGDELPRKVLQKIYLPFSKAIEKYLFKGEESESIRRKIGIGKTAPSVEIIRNALECEEKVVVFAYHTDVILGLEEELKDFCPVVIRGATTDKERQKAVDRFQEDKDCRVFIGQIQAAGEGIDGLQHAARMGIFVETNCPPGTVKQAIGRLNRKGQKHKCLFQFLLVEGTVDEQVLNNTLFKDRNIQTIMQDEELGLDFSNQEPKQKEETMSIEKDLTRIADALEKMVAIMESPSSSTTTADPGAQTAADPVKKEPAKKPAVKKPAAKKPATPAAQATGPTAPAGETADEKYQREMQEAANKISAFNNDPAKTNAMFAELQKEFKAQFPNNEHVFDVAPADYEKVRKLVADFLKKKGVE